MKTTELQINDWVMYEGEPRRITGLDENFVYFEKGCTKCRKATKIIPIPLTSAILERNCFSPVGPGSSMGYLSEDGLTEVYWHKEYKYVAITLDLYQDTEKSYDFPPAYYVHQLQRALRVCGIEKDIEL